MPSTKDPDSPFVAWLRAELHSRGWTMMHLAGLMGVHPSIVGAIISREKAMGVGTARKMAAALGISQIRLFMMAGLIDEEMSEEDAYVLEFRRLVEGMDEATRERVIRVVSVLASEVGRGDKAKAPGRPHRRAAAAGT